MFSPQIHGIRGHGNRTSQRRLACHSNVAYGSHVASCVDREAIPQKIGAPVVLLRVHSGQLPISLRSPQIELDAADFHFEKLEAASPNIVLFTEEGLTLPANTFAAICDEISRSSISSGTKPIRIDIKTNMDKPSVQLGTDLLIDISDISAPNKKVSSRIKSQNIQGVYFMIRSLTARLATFFSKNAFSPAESLMFGLTAHIRRISWLSLKNSLLKTFSSQIEICKLSILIAKYIYFRLKSYVFNPFNLIFALIGRIKNIDRDFDLQINKLACFFREKLQSHVSHRSLMATISDKRLISFGEYHGKGNKVAFITSLIKGISGLTHIALEAPSNLQPYLEQFAITESGEDWEAFIRFARKTFMGPWYLKSTETVRPKELPLPFEDMLPIIKVAITAGIKIVFLDMPPSLHPSSTNALVRNNFVVYGSRDKNYFARIINRLLENPKNKILTYTGSWHSALTTEEYPIPNFTAYVTEKPFSIAMFDDPVVNMLASKSGLEDEAMILPVPNNIYALADAPRLYDIVVYNLPASDKNWREAK